MTQQEVLEYVLARDCYIYEQRVKDAGIFYYVRRNGTKRIVTVYPVHDDLYTPSAVCHICAQLEIIEIPPFAVGYYEIVRDAKSKLQVLKKFPQQGQN